MHCVVVGFNLHFDFCFRRDLVLDQTVVPSGLPSFLNCTERVDEDRLLYQHFGEPLDEGA